jgi:nitrous oxidase accessory protein NosD
VCPIVAGCSGKNATVSWASYTTDVTAAPLVMAQNGQAFLVWLTVDRSVGDPALGRPAEPGCHRMARPRHPVLSGLAAVLFGVQTLPLPGVPKYREAWRLITSHVLCSSRGREQGMSICDNSARGFLSYARRDYYKTNSILKFKEGLEWSIGTSLGSDFIVYHDRSDLPIGENHEQPLREAIEESLFFFAMVSSRYFRNANTRRELEIALSVRDRKGASSYHIVPIYFHQGPEEIYNDPELRNDHLMNVMKKFSFVDDDDWRDLHEHLSSQRAHKKMLSLGKRLANQIRTLPAPRSDTDNRNLAELSRSERCYVVAREGGDFSSIQSAIDHAAPGDQINVRKGEYRESLILNKSLELMGEGIGEVYIKASGQDVLRVETGIGLIAGFSFVQEGETGFGVSISRGRPELHGCEVVSSGYACISVYGEANPRVHNCFVHHGAQAGFLIHSGALGTFEDNEVRECEYANVEVADASTPAFRRNNIHGGRRGGIYVRDGGKGRFEYNDIHHNSWSNVSVTTHASPCFKGNQVRNGNDVGVDVQHSGGGEFEKNTIRWNRKNGVKVSKQASPVFRRNKIHDNTESGVYITDHGFGRLEENHISGNMQAGVAIHESSVPEVRWNIIARNRMQGIQIIDSGDAVIESNSLMHNSDAGITMKPCATIGVRGNRVERNGTYGIEYFADDDQESAANALKANNWLDSNFFGPMNRRTVGEAQTETSNVPDDNWDMEPSGDPQAADPR